MLNSRRCILVFYLVNPGKKPAKKTGPCTFLSEGRQHRHRPECDSSLLRNFLRYSPLRLLRYRHALMSPPRCAPSSFFIVALALRGTHVVTPELTTGVASGSSPAIKDSKRARGNLPTWARLQKTPPQLKREFTATSQTGEPRDHQYCCSKEYVDTSKRP